MTIICTPQGVDEWQSALGSLPHPAGESGDAIMANYILSHLYGYVQSSVSRQGDIELLKTALQAYYRMHYDAQLRPEGLT